MRLKIAETSGWGRVLRANGPMARPEKITALRAVLKQSPAPAIGNLRSYGDAALNSAGRTISMTRLDRFIAFDAETGVLNAEAGVTIGEILRVFSPRGWIPAVIPGTGFATLGGAIANDVHGKNHHGAGSFAEHVLGLDLMGTNGRIRRITPNGNPDIFAATMGGLGQTGIIVAAAIQLIPAGSQMMAVRENRVDGIAEFLAMLDQSEASYSVGWIDATAKGGQLGRGILEEAEIGISADAPREKRAKSVPRDAPQFLLSPPVVRLFNHYYLRRVPAEGRRVGRTMQDFFFPLDRIHNWNRLYGKSGFHQFQCVVPQTGGSGALSEMLERIARSRLASPLAVLKRLGDSGPGLMSFPMAGYTLAVDFPNRANAVGLLGELETLTAQAGGRIYLAKDSTARPETIADMYVKRADFARIANAADPERALETDLVRRLRLREEP